jgi:hypothetical protein
MLGMCEALVSIPNIKKLKSTFIHLLTWKMGTIIWGDFVFKQNWYKSWISGGSF